MAGEADAIAISGGGGDGFGWGGGWPLWFINQQICDGDKEILSTIAHNHCDTVKAIAEHDGRINLHLSNLRADVLREVSDAKVATLLAAKDQALEMCRMKGELATQISGLSHQLSDCCCKIERQLDECCCKLEKEVATSALATQNLIQANESQKLRDQLAAEQQRNLILQLGGAHHGHGGHGGHGGGCRD